MITRDQMIRYRAVERRTWVRHRVRGFVLTGRRSQSTTDSLAILDRHWARIESIGESEPEGPWMYAVRAEGLREIDLA